MSNFASAMNASATTWNGALSYANPDPTGQTSGRISLFFKGVRGLNAPRLYEYLRICANENLEDTFLLAFHLRDCRGGKGERLLGRQAFTWLFINYPKEFEYIFHLIPEYGRWDDLLQFFPSVLKLTDIAQVRANYFATINNSEQLEKLHSLQKRIVRFMAFQLRYDQKNMLAGKPCSLCAKWTPTEGDSLDRKTGVFKELAIAVGVSQRNLRRNFNTPLRAYLKIVEKRMCSGKWSEIDFNKVPSCAMKRLKKAFEKHDPDRFAQWSAALKQGNPNIAKINAKQLHPHEIIREVRLKRSSDEVIEAQWKVLVDEVRKLGSLKDSIVVVDTSSSMHHPNFLPLDVSIAMGMIISEVVEGPFHGQVITFNTFPKFQVVPDGTILERWKFLERMEWGGSTNIETTFQIILSRAKKHNLTQEDMPKRIFIISDMQFDVATGNNTNMKNINEMYKDSGYIPPQIIFWNVNGSSTDFPSTVKENGITMISGFSPIILKSFLKGNEYSSFSFFRSTIDDSRYDPVRQAFRKEKFSKEIDPIAPPPSLQEDDYEVLNP
jgi:hypothetical protein